MKIRRPENYDVSIMQQSMRKNSNVLSMTLNLFVNIMDLDVKKMHRSMQRVQFPIMHTCLELT